MESVHAPIAPPRHGLGSSTRRGGGLLSTLRNLANSQGEAQPVRSFAEIENETLQLTEEVLAGERAKAAAAKPAIPSFFKPKPKPGSLGDLIKKQVLLRREQAKTELILDDGALHYIMQLLEENATHDGDAIKMNYDAFCQVGTQARELYGKAVDPYFRASTFARFQQDGDGCIAVSVFAHYLAVRSQMHGVRLRLSVFDEGDNGQLTEAQLHEFLRTMAMELPALSGMEPWFLDDYARIASRKLLFFHGKNSAVKIKHLLTSQFMQELMDLKNPELASVGASQSLMSNWFSLQSTRRVFNTFVALDEDHNGLLSRREFSQISNGSMSPLFIQRIFEEHVMKQRSNGEGQSHGLGKARQYRDEMDLVAFTDFVLAWDHRSLPAAIKYFYPIMDLHQKGVLSPTELYTFFKEIHAMWVDMGEYADLSIHDVVDEIIDMVQPGGRPLIRVEDLQKSGMSGIFFSILSDVKQFYEYNNRESLMHQDDQE